MSHLAARWLPPSVFLASVCGTLALAQEQRPPGGRATVADSVVCPKCGADIPIQAGTMPTKCPKCGEPITHVVNPDGTKSSTGATVTEKNPYRWVLYGVGGGVLVLAAILAAIKAATGGKMKKKKTKPRAEDVEDEN
jgi:hypothetical protein